MKRLMVILGKIVAMLAIITGGMTFVTYPLATSRMKSDLLAGSHLVDTRAGTIEIATVDENSLATQHVLILHGTPGGYDAGLVLAGWLDLDDQINLIAPSRPGYLRTPIEVGFTQAEAAAAMVALLDTLGIERVAVIGWSGGGGTAVIMVENYPERVSGLVLLSARIRGDDKYTFESTDDLAKGFDPSTVDASTSYFGPDYTNYMQMAGFGIMPKRFLKTFFSEDVEHLDLTVERLIETSATVRPPSVRAIGRHNDYWQFASLPREPEWNITVPTLIIHGTADLSVNFDEHALYMIEKVADAKLLNVGNESHFSTLTQDAAAKIRLFLAGLE